jgi:hypothetical protein
VHEDIVLADSKKHNYNNLYKKFVGVHGVKKPYFGKCVALSVQRKYF